MRQGVGISESYKFMNLLPFSDVTDSGRVRDLSKEFIKSKL